MVFGKGLKNVGYWNYHYCFGGAEGWALYMLTHVLGWRIEDSQAYIARFRAALVDRKNHAYYKV